jgi:hypothetical protein
MSARDRTARSQRTRAATASHEPKAPQSARSGQDGPDHRLSALQLAIDRSPRMLAQRRVLGASSDPALLRPTPSVPPNAPVQRKENELAVQSHPWRTMKQEIAAQYQPPDGALDELWSKTPTLASMAKYQQGGLPYHSRALVAKTPTGSRPSNPASVTVHGQTGNAEALLRGGVTGEPYDGGHLVAYSVMGSVANSYENVAPQGKKLNNGPFSLWEDKVLGGAIRHTTDLLLKRGVKDLPHTFDYDVFVRYPMSHYSVSRETLVDAGLAPRSHMKELPEELHLLKRIPQHWSAHAQPLALPTAAELGIDERPDTPFLLGESARTADYGVVSGTTPNQNFTARGPKTLVDPLNYGMEGELSQGTLDKFRRTPKSLVNNPRLNNFSALKGDGAADWMIDNPFSGSNFSLEELGRLVPLIQMPNSKTVKGATGLRIVNSDYQHWTSTAISVDVRRVLDGKEPLTMTRPQMSDVVESTLQFAGTIQGLLSDKKPPKLVPRDANTLDFTSARQVTPETSGLPDYATLRFEAAETQPD